MAIEIFSNTLLKLVVRNGPDSDRATVTLSLGELGYTTDTKRLYVGDGVTVGGILAGNVFHGEATDVTVFAPAKIGDLAFDSDNNNLYRLKSNDGSVIGDWQLIAGTYSAANNSINISSDNKISVGLLSGGVFDPSSAIPPIYIDNSTGKIALSADIVVDTIRPKFAPALTLFSSLSVNGVRYNWPSTAPTPGQFLQATNGTADLAWRDVSLSAISNKTITVNAPLTATANGVASTGVAINPLTANIVIGLSPTLSSVSYWARYSSSSNVIISNRGISTVLRTGTGRYTFTFDSTLSNTNPYAVATIIGTGAKNYHARVANVSDTTCNVEVYAFDNAFLSTDADIALRVEV